MTQEKKLTLIDQLLLFLDNWSKSEQKNKPTLVFSDRETYLLSEVITVLRNGNLASGPGLEKNIPILEKHLKGKEILDDRVSKSDINFNHPQKQSLFYKCINGFWFFFYKKARNMRAFYTSFSFVLKYGIQA